MALVIAIGVRETGEREILGFELGASEEEAFWREFLRGLAQRGLKGVKLVAATLRTVFAQPHREAAGRRCGAATEQLAEVVRAMRPLTRCPSTGADTLKKESLLHLAEALDEFTPPDKTRTTGPALTIQQHSHKVLLCENSFQNSQGEIPCVERGWRCAGQLEVDSCYDRRRGVGMAPPLT